MRRALPVYRSAWARQIDALVGPTPRVLRLHAHRGSCWTHGTVTWPLSMRCSRVQYFASPVLTIPSVPCALKEKPALTRLLAEPPALGRRAGRPLSSLSSTRIAAVTSSPELRSHSSSIRWGCRRARRCAWCRGAPVVLVLEHEDPYSVAAGSSSGGRPAASPVSTGRREGRSFWLVIFMKCALVLEGVSSARECTDERSQHLWHWPPVATSCPNFGQRLTNGRSAVNTTRPGQVR